MKLPRWITWSAKAKARLRVDVGLGLAHGQDVHECPDCGRCFERWVAQGCHGLSDREMEIIDRARELTLGRLARSRIARFILRRVGEP